MSDDKEYTHESYGMVSFSHRQGSPKLFHSALDHHFNYVTLAIKTARLIRSETGDRVYGPMRGDIVEVDLSAAQFAELITTMNIGLGVPCTIRSLGNQSVAAPPDIDSQPENIRTEFKASAKEFAAKILSRATEAKQLLKDKPSLNKSDRERISNILTEVARELGENMPFMVEMYQEATEKIETAAKAEVEAFMVGAVRQAGLAALAAGQVELAPLQLSGKTEGP